MTDAPRTPSIAVRVATPDDAPALARLRWEFRTSLDTPTESENAFLARCAAWMRPRLAGGAWHAWIAEGSLGETLGTVWVERFEKMPNPLDETETNAYLTNFYVRPEARGAGAGTRLLDAALAWCDAEGVHATILWATRRTRPMYARHGFDDPDALMERTVGRSPSRG